MSKIDASESAPQAGFSRRAAVKLTAIGLIGAAAGAGSSALITRLGRTAPAPYRFFTADEAELVIAICETLIPRDDAPGATDVGVIHYIDRQLSGRLARHREAYKRGLESFRQTCLREYKMAFAQLSPEQKVEALRLIEAGGKHKELWKEPTAPAFFRLVLAHTMQGFYGPPRHGGNRDYASYRMLGVDYPQIIGQNRARRVQL